MRVLLAARAGPAVHGLRAVVLVTTVPSAATDYHAAYVRLGGARRRFTSFDPLGPGLAAGDGRQGGMIDEAHAAGKPSRRELEIAAWLDRDVPPELEAAQFDIATLLAAVENLRYLDGLATRNMLDAEHRAHEAERLAAETPAGKLAGLLARAYLRISHLEGMLALACGGDGDA